MSWWNDASSLANSLVAYWKSDEASGNRSDSVGSNTLTDNNTVTSNTGIVYSNAAEFASANSEYLSIADNTVLSMADIQMFFGGWVYLTSKSAVMMAFSKTDSGANQRAYFVEYDSVSDRILAGFNPTGSGASTTVSADSLGSPALNTWYFVLAWHDSVANTINISIDGHEPNSVSYSSGIFDNTTAFRIGASSSSGTVTNFWNGRIGPVFVGKNHLPTVAERFAMFQEAPNNVLSQWWLGNAQIPSANVLEHVEVPSIAQTYAGTSVASGQPWTLAVRSFSYLATTNVARTLFDSQNGRFIAGISTSSAYGFYNGSAWQNPAIFNSSADQIWFFVNDGSHIQAYLNNVAVGSNIASTVGLATSGTTRWGKIYDNSAGTDWNNPIIAGAVYDKALDAVERQGLYYAMRDLDTLSQSFTADGTWIAPDGVSIVDVVAWGPGGSGANPAGFFSGGGGGGGAYAASTDVVITPGNSYSIVVGAGGSGTSSDFPGDSEHVTADAGNTPSGTTGGAGGTTAASVGDTLHAGGSGGNGSSGANTGGAGGGGSAGATGNGGTGGNDPGGGSPGNGGAAGSGGGASGGAGGRGINGNSSAGVAGNAAGGGGGGAPSTSEGAGSGARGQVTLTWIYIPPVDVEDIIGSVDGTSTVNGLLKATGVLSGTVAGVSTSIADVVGKFQLAGSVDGTSIVTGRLTKRVRITGSIDGSSSIIGIVRAKGSLTGNIDGLSTAIGLIFATGFLNGLSTGSTDIIAFISNSHVQSGHTAGKATVSGTLVAFGYISGNLVATSIIIGAIMALGKLNTNINVHSFAIGNLTVVGFVPEGEIVVALLREMEIGIFKSMR